MKPFIEVFTFYYGCDIDISQTEYGQKELEMGRLKSCVLKGFRVDDDKILLFLKTNLIQHSNGDLWLDIDVVKPVLRRLPSITVEELCDVYKLINKNWEHHDQTTFAADARYFIFKGMSLEPQASFNVDVMAYLLLKGFDLFDLIGCGFANEKK